MSEEQADRMDERFYSLRESVWNWYWERTSDHSLWDDAMGKTWHMMEDEENQ